jgi:ABC transport system ATP-binding/permease protein
MNLLNADRIEKAQGGRVLFSDITCGIQDGEKVALIGENGCGKTTFLKILAGRETVDKGTVTRSTSCRISCLEQQSQPNPDDSIIEHILQGNTPRAKMLRRYELCAERAHAGDAVASEELSHMADEMEHLDAWDYERRIQSVLEGFGITDLGMKMGTLSGGMAKKVALAQALIEDSNCLFLDEPTNHLDVESIIWLQEYLQNYSGAVIMVTHDRYFLDEVCTGIFEIDSGRLFYYKGNYSYYLDQKAARIDSQISTDKRVANILRTELEWLRRGPKARGTKAKARKDRIYTLMDHSEYKEADALEIAVTGKRLGKKILELDSIYKHFDERVILSSFTHVFKHGERVGVVGANGSGKTTLLNILTGRLLPDGGTIDTGIHTSFGFFTQNSAVADPSQRVIDFVEEHGKTITLADGSYVTASKMLEIFLFPAGLHATPVSKLSGGERRRLFLLQVLMSNPNFLVLDEPTNDFDVKTLSILEDFLQNFAGCIIVVSHDRYFMDRIADYLFVLDGSGSVKSFPGSFTEYLAFAKEQKKESVRSASDAEKKDTRDDRRQQKEKKKLSFKESREYETIEDEIKKLEEEKEALLLNINQGTDDHLKYAEWSARLEELEKIINEKYARWEYLEQFVQ